MPSIERLARRHEELAAVTHGAELAGERAARRRRSTSPLAVPPRFDKKSMFWSKEVDAKDGRGRPRRELELRAPAVQGDGGRDPEGVPATRADAPPRQEGRRGGRREEAREEQEGGRGGGRGRRGGGRGGRRGRRVQAAGRRVRAARQRGARRQYDSIDNFNDYRATAFSKKAGAPSTRPSAAASRGRPSSRARRRPPQLGDEDTPYEQVAKFYKFWFEFSSWRDFSLLSEHDLKEAEDREEKRWMMRQNKNQTDRIKKDEGTHTHLRAARA